MQMGVSHPLGLAAKHMIDTGAGVIDAIIAVKSSSCSITARMT